MSRRRFLRTACFLLTSLSILFAVITLEIACKKEESPIILERITFGSCASEQRPQPIWDIIVAQEPDLFIFLGDNIYADTEDMTVMQAKYDMLASKPGYQKLLSTTPILSTWDDHDYGANDAGADYPKKVESEKIFLDFFGVPQDSPRRRRQGIYDAKIFGEPGKQVQVILLDTRYFKGPQVRNTESDSVKREKNIVGWYVPTEDTATTILGEAQWQWLETQLQRKADLRIIASSIQVIAYEKGMESWGNFPHERRRLFNLIEKTRANGVIFISGDVHFSEISVSREGLYPLYDFTSSGLTHARESWSRAVNSYRDGDAYAKPNFGLIHIDWDQADPQIRLQTIAQDSHTIIQHAITLSELTHR